MPKVRRAATQDVDFNVTPWQKKKAKALAKQVPIVEGLDFINEW